MQAVLDDLCWLYHYTPAETRELTLAEIRRLYARAMKAAEPTGGD